MMLMMQEEVSAGTLSSSRLGSCAQAQQDAQLTWKPTG